MYNKIVSYLTFIKAINNFIFYLTVVSQLHWIIVSS